MSARGPSIAPRSEPSPIAIAGSPPSSGPSPRPFTNSGASPASASSPPRSVALAPNNVTQIITSKEWVLPPRPKPGRKPSVDTPASKRKAQNRAAQRAFRERRATRVQELEQKLMEVEKEKEVKEMALVNTINKLKVENQFLLKNIEQLRNDVQNIKNNQSQTQSTSVKGQSAHQIKSSFSLGGDASANASPANLSSSSPASTAYSVQQISPAPSADSPPGYAHTHNNHQHRHSHSKQSATSSNLTPLSSNTTPDKPVVQQNSDTSNFDCGVCLKDDCLCESVGLKTPATRTKAEVKSDNDIAQITKALEETINSFKPMAAVSLASKKRKVSSVAQDEQEIDFTEVYTTKSKPMPDLKKLKKSSSDEIKTSNSLENSAAFNEDSPVENCGFCSYDTPCVCREAAKEAALLNSTLHQQSVEDIDELEDELSAANKTLPPLQLNSNNFRKSSLPVMHPGPSVEIREITNLTPGAVPTVVTSTRRGNSENASSSSFSSVNTTNSNENKNKNKDSSECTGNPGTCRQCQMDPLSTLFCTTVANKEQTETSGNSSTPQPILSRNNSKASLPSMVVPNLTNPSTPGGPQSGTRASTPAPGGSTNTGMFIPCADAYKTLSRHKKFDSVDFSTLVGKLTTRGMQVEVQSVANVLRELDRRLYH
ncbi:jun-like transcription factor [Scheffersomyces xylosifermentans]|uniref:jun-like transcription factor n=1 Tax=Scheffersomyces xylosifermentans TaxID=1304137 RepID=UPI00315D0D93